MFYVHIPLATPLFRPQVYGRSQMPTFKEEQRTILPTKIVDQKPKNKSRKTKSAKAMLESIRTRKAVPQAALMTESRRSMPATSQSNKRAAPKLLTSSRRGRKVSKLTVARVARRMTTRMPIMARSRRRSLASPRTRRRTTTRVRSSARICIPSPHR